jgi:hypothetical protein
MPEPGDGTFEEPGKSKQRDKARCVWISFVGRMVAQIIGAIAVELLTAEAIESLNGP